MKPLARTLALASFKRIYPCRTRGLYAAGMDTVLLHLHFPITCSEKRPHLPSQSVAVPFRCSSGLPRGWRRGARRCVGYRQGCSCSTSIAAFVWARVADGGGAGGVGGWGGGARVRPGGPRCGGNGGGCSGAVGLDPPHTGNGRYVSFDGLTRRRTATNEWGALWKRVLETLSEARSLYQHHTMRLVAGQRRCRATSGTPRMRPVSSLERQTSSKMPVSDHALRIYIVPRQRSIRREGLTDSGALVA